MTKNDLSNKSVSLMKERDGLIKQVKKLTLENKKLTKQLTLTDVSKSLMNKKWAESRERTARVREQIAIERFIEVYYDGEDDLTFEDVNKRLRLH